MSDAAALRSGPAAEVWSATVRRWRTGLFDSPLNIAITLGCIAVFIRIAVPLLRWAVLDATWAGTPETCARASGACWAFIGEKLRFILFGLYPPADQWQPLLAMGLLFGLCAASGVPRLWGQRLIISWVVVLTLSLTIMRGGIGSHPVPTAAWGGLPLTLLMSLLALAGAFPLAIALALGRQSTLGLVRLLCVTFIEVIRGVPLIAVLYVAALLVPLMLPPEVTIDQLLRAQIGITIFVSAYMAEVVRSGLQSLPSSQYEAARALGLGDWAAIRLVILPQALRSVIPSFVTLALGVLQDTTLVVVIGIFDFLNAARISANDPNWLGFYDEAFSFAAAVYFVLCFAGSRYSLWLERRLGRE